MHSFTKYRSPGGFCNFEVAAKSLTEKRLGLLQKKKIKLVLLITQLFDTETERNISLTTPKSNEARQRLGNPMWQPFTAHNRQNTHCINSLLEENGEP